MKQKNLKYPLIFGVTLVWGLIIYKVVNGLGNNDSVTPLTLSQKKIDYTQVADSFLLIADYPDPFIPNEENVKDKEQEEQATTVVNPTTRPVTASPPPKPAFDPSIIKYTGMIANPENKLKVAILVIGGKEYLVKEKERIDEYKIRSITKEKVVILFKGVSYTIESSK